MAPRRRPKIKKAAEGPPKRIRALEIEDVVENIVGHAFSDRQDEDGVYNYEALPKRFLGFALVSRTFVNPVRRCLYGELLIEGPERFLLLTGQLRFAPHLAKFVKAAELKSACHARNFDDTLPYFQQAPGQDDPRPMSSLALKWFLDACPQLTRLNVNGGDFLWPLSVQDPKLVRLTHIPIYGCFRCDHRDPSGCWSVMKRGGWLKNILAFPNLVELEVDNIELSGGDDDPTLGVPSGSSVGTELTASVLQKWTALHSLETLLRAMPRVKELVLDGLTSTTPAELKKCIGIVADTLTLLAINTYPGLCRVPMHLDDSFFAKLRCLEQLALNNVSVSPSILSSLPPKLRLLRFSGAVTSFSAPALVKWLQTSPFRLPALKELFILGELPQDAKPLSPPASEVQKEEISRLCQRLGVDVKFEKKNRFSSGDGEAAAEDFDEEDSDSDWDGPQHVLNFAF
ncbi:hypothetical protein C8F01DRAFT_1098765 [Mycena amicta]|nr:hypothetical protein C8F01DRAFT_1098765 [Mycena amicta]